MGREGITGISQPLAIIFIFSNPFKAAFGYRRSDQTILVGKDISAHSEDGTSSMIDRVSPTQPQPRNRRDGEVEIGPTRRRLKPIFSIEVNHGKISFSFSANAYPFAYRNDNECDQYRTRQDVLPNFRLCLRGKVYRSWCIENPGCPSHS
jgi:hypothetical protein